jgi:hypothetical protein
MTMPSFIARVKYRYRKQGTNPWSNTSISFTVNHESETLVMQKLRDKHKGCEVEMKEIKWQ